MLIQQNNLTLWAFLKGDFKFHLLVTIKTFFSSFFKFRNFVFFSKSGGSAGDLISKSVCFDSAWHLRTWIFFVERLWPASYFPWDASVKKKSNLHTVWGTRSKTWSNKTCVFQPLGHCVDGKGTGKRMPSIFLIEQRDDAFKILTCVCAFSWKKDIYGQFC